MYRLPGKGAGSASNYSAANKRIASFSSVITPMVNLCNLNFAGWRFLGNLFPSRSFVRVTRFHDLFPLPPSHRPDMGTLISSSRWKMVRPPPKESLLTSMGKPSPRIDRWRIQWSWRWWSHRNHSERKKQWRRLEHLEPSWCRRKERPWDQEDFEGDCRCVGKLGVYCLRGGTGEKQ